MGSGTTGRATRAAPAPTWNGRRAAQPWTGLAPCGARPPSTRTGDTFLEIGCIAALVVQGMFNDNENQTTVESQKKRNLNIRIIMI